MNDKNSGFAISGYSKQTAVVSGFTSLVTGIIKNLKHFPTRMQDEQAKARLQSNRKRSMLHQVHQQSIERMPLEKLIRMGFYHF
ncbi:MAG: hypothetical protein LJE92_05280 [Gammaproteobacteria bacterium]|jgi:hypothetical protein|nr:hypothetical protein [Gammaproteobacteria bacterium]